MFPKCLHLVMVVVVSLLLKCADCFFVQHNAYLYRTRGCIKDTGRIQSSGSWGNLSFLELSSCLDPASQFRFRDNGAMLNLKRQGCLAAFNKPGSGYDLDMFYLYVDSVSLDTAACAQKPNQSIYRAITQTTNGALSVYYKRKGKKSSFENWCAVRRRNSKLSQSYGIQYYIGLTTSCQHQPTFIFGSVTCYGDEVENANCPKDQYMVVKFASYRGLHDTKTCGLSDDYICEVDVTCLVKKQCDGLHECNITVDENLFSADLCPGLSNYLYFKYRCVDTVKPYNESCVHDVSLSHSSVPYKGVVQITTDSGTKNVCWQSLNDRAKNIVCRHLGYNRVHSLVNISTPSDAKDATFSGNINCNGKEKYLSQCSITASASESCSELSYIQCGFYTSMLSSWLRNQPPLLEDKRRFPDSSFSASASSEGHSASDARISSGSSWCAPVSDEKYYLQVDLGRLYYLHYFITYGDSSSPKWVAKYNLNYTIDRDLFNWKTATGIFSGNKNAYDHAAWGYLIVNTRALRFISLTYVGQPCMRVDIWGFPLSLDKPTNLTVTNITSRSAEISWQDPKNPGIYGPLRFWIKLRKDDSLILNITTRKVNNYEIHNLTPYTTYQISVAAGNIFGLGEETVTLFLTTSEAVLPDKPTNLTVTNITSKSAEISWQDPKDPGRYGLSRFWINLKNENVLVLNITTGKVNNYEINNLTPHTTYQISVAAGNRYGFGEETITSFLTFEETALPDKPRNLTVNNITSKTAEISWQDPKDPGRYGLSRFWIKLKNENVLVLNITTGKINNYEINNLTPHTTYQISVAAGNYFCFGEEIISSFLTSEGPCASEKVGTVEAYGILVWPDTPVGHRSTIACPYNNESIASRECWYTTQTERGSVWGPTDVTQCKYKDIRSKELFALVQNEVNVSNVVGITQEVKNLSSSDPGHTLQAGDISNIATVLENIVSVKQKANEVSDDFFATIDNVLDARIEDVLRSQQNENSSSRIVEAINNFAETLVINSGTKFEKVNRHFAVTLQAAQPQTFTGLAFSGIVRKSSESALKKNSVSTQSTDSVPIGSSASISIPRSIFNESTITNSSRQETVIFVLYQETKFFGVSLVDTGDSSSRLNSFVIAGSIKGLSITNLSEPVKIVFQSIAPGDTNSTLCSYWDFSLGNWSQEGCRFERVLEDGRILCECNHLTNFAILMDINPGMTTKHDKVLGVISYVGSALSLVGLILTIVTILILRELKSQIPGQILLNFCVALSLSLIVFLAAVEKSKTSSLAGCRTAAIALHYFLLAAFLWMAVEAFNMYLACVKIFPCSSPSKFMLKCCLFAWGLPAVIVAITAMVALDKYGDDIYCRLHGVPFIVAFFTPVSVIIVGNIVAFCFIIRSLVRSGTKVTSVQKVSGYQRARQSLAIMVLLGLTWIFGILAIGDAKLVFQYLFCIFNTLQGLFVFILFCILPVETRRQLRNLIRKNAPWRKGEENENASFDNLAYSSKASHGINTTELKFQSSTSDDPVVGLSYKSNAEDLQTTTNPIEM